MRREKTAVSRVSVSVLRGEMGNLYCDSSARPQDPVNVPKHRHILEVLKYILTKYFRTRIAIEGQRDPREVMTHVDARQVGLVHVNPSAANIFATSQVHSYLVSGACCMS